MNSNSSTECPFCLSATTPFELGETLFHRCGGCGFVFKDARHHVAPAAARTRYDLHAATPDPEYVRSMERFIDNYVHPFKKAGSALDFGCGRTGTVIGLLRRHGFDAIGYDPLYAPAPEPLLKRYDVVVATEVVEHFEDPGADWAKLVGLALPGGLIAVTTRFVPLEFAQWWYPRDITHYSFYTEATLRRIADRHRLRVASTDGATAIAFIRE